MSVPYSGSLPALAEEVLNDVAKSVYADLQIVFDALMPDGRPFGYKKLSKDDELKRYLDSGLHDDPKAAEQWIRNKVQELVQLLQSFGVPEDKLAKAHPYDVVLAQAYKWSAKMEVKLVSRIQMITEAIAQPEEGTVDTLTEV